MAELKMDIEENIIDNQVEETKGLTAKNCWLLGAGVIAGVLGTLAVQALTGVPVDL